MPNFDRLLSASLWENVLYMFLGFVAATAFENVVSGQTSTQIPPEAYGVGTILVVEMAASGKVRRYAQVGAGFHTLDHLLTRFELRSQVRNIGK